MNVIDCFLFFRVGILDVLLCCIAKALSVQVRSKGREGAASKGQKVVMLQNWLTLQDDVGPRWWLRGYTSRKLAEVVIVLLKDMAAVSTLVSNSVLNACIYNSRYA